MAKQQQQRQQLQQQQDQDSIWYYNKRGFKELIDAIIDKSVTVATALKGFREYPCLTKTFSHMRLEKVAASPQLIEQLYEGLRNGMPESKKFRLPYKKAVRELELIQSLAKTYDVDIDRAKAKVVTGYFDGDNTVFPYAIEAVIAPRKNWKYRYKPGDLEFIGCINDSPAIDGGEKYFSDGLYTWKDKKSGEQKTATSAREILQKCGFGDDLYKSKRRMPSVFLMNLLTPLPQWLGAAGKTHINLKPYAIDIAETVSFLAYHVPTCHGQGFAQISFSTGGRDESQVALDYVREFLKKRKAAIEANPNLKIIDRITQSGVWYRIRPKMTERSFQPPLNWSQTRRYLQAKIQDVIDELWSDEQLTREDLGIVAASKGVFLYNGEAWPINGETVDVLAEKGAAIIVIEKEGVADVLEEYAKKYGIALAHTGGRFTNAIKKLIERAKDGGSVVRILTDYDAVGMDIAAATITPTIRIGIERDIINWLQDHGLPGLLEEDVEEEYTPSGTAIEIKDEYLKTKRIELDSIQEKVGGEKLWEYIMYRLQLPEFSTGFNLTKVIEMPTTGKLRPQQVKDVLQHVDSYIEKLTENRRKEIQTELESSMELPEKRRKEIEIEEKLVDKIEDAEQKDKGLRTIVTRFTELLRPGILPRSDDYASSS
ncbi:MAG TPA: hypothetical protein VFR94_00690 [Nitrososphaeraceae archaeon]|nr:hypothetical protein [Nitrososphaeraceae archaeon]